MVPSSVIEAWKGLPEQQKVAVCRLCARKQPLVFSRWVDAAGLKRFRHESLVNRKAGSAPRLDAALFRDEGGQLAMDVLVSYFTELSAEINDQYLAMLESAGNEERQTRLEIYAQLALSHKDSPFIKLYLATALWVGDLREEDIDLIETMAAELSAAAQE